MGISNNTPPLNDAQAKLTTIQNTIDVLTLLESLISDPSELTTLGKQAADAYKISDDAKAQNDALLQQASDAKDQIAKLAAAQSDFSAQQKAFNDMQAPALQAIQDATDAQVAIYDKKKKDILDAQALLDAQQIDINTQKSKLASDLADLQQKSDNLDAREQTVAAREDAIAKAKAALS